MQACQLGKPKKKKKRKIRAWCLRLMALTCHYTDQHKVGLRVLFLLKSRFHSSEEFFIALSSARRRIPQPGPDCCQSPRRRNDTYLCWLCPVCCACASEGEEEEEEEVEQQQLGVAAHLWQTAPGNSSHSCMNRNCGQRRHSWWGGTVQAGPSDTGHTWLAGWTWPGHTTLLVSWHLFFFCVPQLYLWASPLWVTFLHMWPFFQSNH